MSIKKHVKCFTCLLCLNFCLCVGHAAEISLQPTMESDRLLIVNEKIEDTVVIQAYEHEFKRLVDTEQKPILLYDKGVWLEGPQILPNGDVVFSDVKSNALLVMQRDEDSNIIIREWQKPSHFQNGHALDKKGRLIAASHGKRAIERLNDSGEWEIIIDSYQGKKFNSPNDVIVDSDGDIWFSDPSFGLLNPLEGYGGSAEQEGDFVYRYSPQTKAVVRLNTPLLKAPNGLAFSPDEKVLYVADSELAYDFNSPTLKSQILAYDVGVDKQLYNARILAVIDSGIPDGIKVDIEGNIWSSSGNGIYVFAPSGRKIGYIQFPHVVGNFTFHLNDSAIRGLRVNGVNVAQKAGKPLLYITAGNKFYKLKIKTQSGIKR